MTLNEQYLAGCILLEHSVIWGLDGIVTAEDFEDNLCRAIFVAANEIKNEGCVVDPASIRARAFRNGTELQYDYIKQLLDITPTAANFAEYGQRVAEDARTRRIKELAAQIQFDEASTADELLDRLQEEAGKLSERSTTEKRKGFDVISAQDLKKADLPPINFLIAKILPEGTSLITAASKIGKSWMVLDMGLCIAAGKPFMGFDTHKCGVLYLALEDSLTRLQERMNNILGNEPVPKDFHFVTKAPKMGDGLLEMLKDHFKNFPNTKLVIIDTLQKIRGQALPRESAYAQDYREMETLKDFFDKNRVSSEFVHHNRKMGDDSDPFNMISGTTGIMGAADTIWTITKKRADQEATLHTTGRDVMQMDIIIRFDRDSHRWKSVGSADLIAAQRDRLAYDSNPIAKTIRELLKQSKDGEWRGTAKDLLAEGKMICNRPISISAQKLGYELRSLDTLLLEYDGIVHKRSKNGNAGNLHQFFYQNWTDEAAAHEQDDDLLPMV